MKIVKLIIILFAIINPYVIKSNGIDYKNYNIVENDKQDDKNVDVLELTENILINIELRKLSKDFK